MVGNDEVDSVNVIMGVNNFIWRGCGAVKFLNCTVDFFLDFARRVASRNQESLQSTQSMEGCFTLGTNVEDTESLRIGNRPFDMSGVAGGGMKVHMGVSRFSIEV